MVRKFVWNDMSEELEKIQATLGQGHNHLVTLATNHGVANVMVEHAIVWDRGRFVCTGFLASDWNGFPREEQAMFYRLNEDAFYILQGGDYDGKEQA